MLSLKIIVAATLFAVLPTAVTAQEHDASHHGEMDAPSKITLPTEPGQGAFAAIAEIVVLLNADPSTDWSKVNIGALRTHLVDMDQLTLNAQVETKISDNMVQFEVAGVGRTYDAIRAMVPAHANELSASTDWSVQSELTDTGAVLLVSSNDTAEIAKIAALGFFGIMATGAHHQEHHFMIAAGASVH